MLVKTVQEALEQALDYTERLEKLTLEATHDLPMPGEMVRGLSAQRQRLAELVGSFRDELGGSADGEAIDQWLFGRIGDVWSLHTQNEAFLPLCGHLFSLLSGEAAERLRRDLHDQVCILHISCRPRLDRAQRSIESFNSFEGDLRHLVVVGDPQGRRGGFRFTYEDSLLTLRWPDDYPGHCGKCLLSYALLALVAAPRLIYKLDDDVLLNAADVFAAHLQDLIRNEVVYAGHPVAGFPNHRKFWHGWHLGKCQSRDLEAIGYQAPIASQYAEGGLGYALGRRSLEELAYAFFTHQAFLGIGTILYEDVTVGLFLQVAGIALTPVAPFASGLTSERHRMQRDIEASWSHYAEREQAGLDALQQHPIRGLGGGAAATEGLTLADPAQAAAGSPARFDARVRADLQELVRRCLGEQERLGSFRPRRIHLASRRLDRYFDPDLASTLEGSLRGVLEAAGGAPALAEIERITVAEELGPPRHDTLYLVCLHQENGELEEIQGIRANTNSLVIGWFWDNHHNYSANSELATELDICVPAHHHGSGFLSHANPRTTHPLPLCCAQWSMPTLDRLLAEKSLPEQRSATISGRFTDWFSPYLSIGGGVGTRRRDLVRSYADGLLHEQVQLQLEPHQNYAYFSLSAEERFADWCQHHFSLCLPLRADLSLRFFDAIVAGQLPIVDRELAGVVLDDLAPSLIAGRDYLLVDVSSPDDLLAAREHALDPQRRDDREAASLRVRRGHLLEHRVALVAEACLDVVQEQRLEFRQQAWERSQSAGRQALAACLAALAVEDDRTAVDQLGVLLEQSPTALKRLDGRGVQWMEVLAGIDRRIQAGKGNEPAAELKPTLCWQGVAAVDRLGELLPAGDLPPWLPMLNELFSRYGALLWREAATAGGVGAREARQRAIVLLLRLSRLHEPCPEWVLLAARELLAADLADERALPEGGQPRQLVLRQWQRQLAAHPELMEHLKAGFEQARQLAARRLSISVVIPFHGRVNELEMALGALEKQTLRDFELVVVADGCAVDEQVLEGLRGQGVCASVLRLPESQGAFRARGAGAAITSGAFLWFLDHDDSVEPRFLERMLERAESTQADVVECPFWVVPPEGAAHAFQRFEGETVRTDAAILESYLLGESHNNLANKLIRRSLWQAAMEELATLDLADDATLIFCEDLLCTVLLYRQAGIYASTIHTEYRYLQRADSTSNSSDPAVIEACLTSMETVLRALEPLLKGRSTASSLAAFRSRELAWNLDRLLRRVDRALAPKGWERVGRIQQLLA